MQFVLLIKLKIQFILQFIDLTLKIFGFVLSLPFLSQIQPSTFHQSGISAKIINHRRFSLIGHSKPNPISATLVLAAGSAK